MEVGKMLKLEFIKKNIGTPLKVYVCKETIEHKNVIAEAGHQMEFQVCMCLYGTNLMNIINKGKK